MTLFGSIKELFHSVTTADHYASYSGDKPAGHDAVPLRSNPSSTDLYVHGNRSAQLNSAPTPSNVIPMAPLGPSVKMAWQRVLKWMEEGYPELYDAVQYGATERDIAEFEHDLDVALPQDVRESMIEHDGQERGGRPTGLFFGIELMDLESIMEEWSVWRRAAIRVNERERELREKQERFERGPSSSAASAPVRGGVIPTQRSCPPEAVQTVYAHPAWVPLAKDGGGNNIAVDLAPGPNGRSGQIILFGRDFDTKYVIAQSWSHFLDGFANDIEHGHPYVDDDIEEPIFAIRENGRMVSYLDLLRRRATPRPTRSGANTPRLISPVPSSTQLSVMKLEPKAEAAELKRVEEEAAEEAAETRRADAASEAVAAKLSEEPAAFTKAATSTASASAPKESTPVLTVEEPETETSKATEPTSTTAEPELQSVSLDEPEATPDAPAAATSEPSPEPAETAPKASSKKSKKKNKKNKA